MTASAGPRLVLIVLMAAASLTAIGILSWLAWPTSD